MNYLIVGNGRLSRHLQNYFSYLNLTYTCWSRKEGVLTSNARLQKLVSQADRVLLAISDNSIESFAAEHNLLNCNKLVHFSGAHSFEFAAGAHLLNSFSQDLYSREVYESTPIIVDRPNITLSDLLPGLPNPYFYLPPEKKALYHSLCVMGGNFSTLIWQGVLEILVKELNLPAATMAPYIVQTFNNLIRDHKSALTGPISRGDATTIIRNLDALRDRPEQKLYYAFLNYHLEKKKSLGDLNYERLDI